MEIKYNYLSGIQYSTLLSIIVDLLQCALYSLRLNSSQNKTSAGSQGQIMEMMSITSPNENSYLRSIDQFLFTRYSQVHAPYFAVVSTRCSAQSDIHVKYIFTLMCSLGIFFYIVVTAAIYYFRQFLIRLIYYNSFDFKRKM